MNHDECNKREDALIERCKQHRQDIFAYRNALIEACNGDMKRLAELYQKYAEASELKKEKAFEA